MLDMKYTPKSEIDSRIEKLQAILDRDGLDGAIIVHHTNLFYLSGTSQSGHLFVPRCGKPILIVRKSFRRAVAESPIENIMELRSLKNIPGILRDAGFDGLGKIGFELDVIPVNTWAFYKKVFEGSALVDVSGAVKEVRLIKSPYEIGLLEGACGVLDQVFALVPSFLKEGMTEIELASLFEGGMRQRGYGGCSKMRAFNQDFFLGNVNSGDSGAVPSYFDGPVGGSGLTPANNPHGAGWKKIEAGEIVYIDYTCVKDGYTADATRMFVIGEPSPKIAHAHETALMIQEEVASMAKPSVPWEALYLKSLELAEKAGLGEHFMGMGEDRVRFLGHGVGLELDELPVFAKGLKMPLEPGMTFALEPKFVFPEGAVGIENTFVMTGQGARPLTRAPQEILKAG